MSTASTANLIPIHKPELRTEIVDVTPDLAREWLGRNTRNRRLKLRVIANYTRDMQAGHWRLTGEAIKFGGGADGPLLDGQNRLHAVIRSDTTTRMLVIWGLPDGAQDVMDGGARRTNADQLTLHDVPNASAVASIAAAWTGWQASTWPNAGSMIGPPQLTHAETLQLVDDHPEIIDAARIGTRVFKTLRLPVGVLGAAWMVTQEIDADDADVFFNCIADMETTGTGDPIAALLKKVRVDSAIDAGVRGKRICRAGEAFYLIFRAWNAWRSRELMHNIKTRNYKHEAIAMPVPK